MSRVLVSGSMAYDRIMDFPGYFREHFLPDKMHAISVSFQVDTTAENFGGTAGNIAYNLSLFGVEPHIIATAGADFERYARYLKILHVDPTSVKIEPKSTTSAAFVMTDKEDNQIAAFSMGAGKIPYLPLPTGEGARCAIIGAGCIRDMQTLPGHYRELGLQYMYDPGQAIPALSPDDLNDGMSGAAVLFANDYEFALITAKTKCDIPQLLEKVAVIVVTYGEKGSRVMTKEKEITVAAVPAEAKDPTGAGDAYRAGYIAGMLKNITPEECAKIGSVAAAYAVGAYGTQSHHFTLAELGTRYESAYGAPLSL